LREYIREWLLDNEIAVAYVPEGLQNSASQTSQESAPSEQKAHLHDVPSEPSEHDEQIKFLLDEFVRPAVEQDGGAIDFHAYKEGKVYVTMRGACSGCPSSMQTLKGGIENLLKAHIQDVEEVVAVGA
ncbi:MAG: hypothetical protein RL226_148, partial [Bacteroidota bacterium]